MVLIALAVACGGAVGPPDVLTGDVPTMLVFVGAWSEQEQAATRAFIEALNGSGYFVPLAREHGADPHFRLVTSGSVLTVRMWGKGTHDGSPADKTGLHSYETNGDVSISIFSNGLNTFWQFAPALSHELAEASASPDLRSGEVADPCEHDAGGDSVQLEVAGVLRWVSRYMTLAGCWPAA